MRILSLCSLLLCAAFSSSADISKFPEWNQAKSWQFSGPLSAANASDGALKLVFNSDMNNVGQLRLNTPFPVPPKSSLFSYEVYMSANFSQARLFLLVRDARGEEFKMQCKQPFTNLYHGDVNILNSGQQKGKIYRHEVPALFRTDMEARRTVLPKDKDPKHPLTILGFELVGNRQKHHPDLPLEIYLSRFAFSDNDLDNSAYAWQFKGAPGTLECDGLPSFTLSDLVDTAAGELSLNWDVRRDYAGFPFLEGREEIVLKEGQPSALARKIEIPQLPEGTYWVRLHGRLAAKPGAKPQILERELRLFVVNSKVKAQPKAEKTSPLLPVRILPRDGGMIFDDNTGSIRVAVEGGKVGAKILTPNLGTLKASFDFPGTEPRTLEIPLKNLVPGAYRLELVLEDKDKVERLFGIRGAKAAKPAEVPASVTTAKEYYGAKARSTFPISPMIHSISGRARPNVTRLDFIENIMKQTVKVSRDLEHSIPWSRLEPLPGIYDFEEYDRELALSEKLGLEVVLWPMTSEAPEWMPSIFVRTVDGKIFYDFAYHFNGGRLNYSQSPELQGYFGNLYRELAKRYAGHPAVGGYFMCMELPGDAPFMGWIEGGDALTLDNFRQAMQKQYISPGEMNKAWGTQFATFKAATRPGKNASRMYWRDWMRFRAVGYDRLLRSGISAIREFDPARLIWVYGDFPGLEMSHKELRDLGCALANGGSHDAIHPFALSQIGLAGMIQRTEDHWPGKWSGYFPTVLDASVFAMSYGGSRAMNSKSYIFSWAPDLPEPLTLDALRKPPYSFDRFEQFMPIWSELRRAERAPVDAIMLLDMESFLISNRTMNRNGFWNGYVQSGLYQSRLNFGAAELPLALEHAKLLLTIKDHLTILGEEKQEKLLAFVKNGGTLLMLPESGRYTPESEKEDFTLLRRFGFAPPTAEQKGAFVVKPAANAILTPGGNFRVEGKWAASQQPEGVVHAATFPDGSPALSLRKIGKGTVAVLWGNMLTPEWNAPENARHPLLRDFAALAGSAVHAQSDELRFWINFMHNEREGLYYALAHYGVLFGKKGPETTGFIKMNLPEGRYEVTEMISGEKLGAFTGAELAAKGVPATMKSHEVRIFRARKIK